MRLTILTWQGLGDTLLTLPVCYHYEALGHEVHLVNTVSGFPQRRQLVGYIPTYPDIREGVRGRVLDLTQWHFDWHARGSLMQAVFRTGTEGFVEVLGEVEETGAPRMPWLRFPEGTDWTREHTCGGEAYVVIAPEGTHHSRQMTEEQVCAIAEAAPCVLLHPEPWPTQAKLTNLSGKLPVHDIMPIVAAASAVVSVDTGTLHLAAAFGTPLLALTSEETIHAEALAHDYKPSVFCIVERDTTRVSPDMLTALLETVFVAGVGEQEQVPASGAYWWQQGELRTRMARAETHQRRLTDALGGSNVVRGDSPCPS